MIWRRRFESDPYGSCAGGHWALVQAHGGALPSGELLTLMLESAPSSDDLIQVRRGWNIVKRRNVYRIPPSSN